MVGGGGVRVVVGSHPNRNDRVCNKKFGIFQIPNSIIDLTPRARVSISP